MGMSLDEYKKLYTKKRSKYGNRRVEYDGQKFDSAGECERYKILKIYEQQGLIYLLQCQVPFKCIVSDELICTYKADFTYALSDTHRDIIEDFKGMRTALYKLKKKLVKAIYMIDIFETTKDDLYILPD